MKKLFKSEKRRKNKRVKKKRNSKRYIKQIFRSAKAYFKALPGRVIKADVRNYITVDIIAFSLFLAVKRYSGSIVRFFSSIQDVLTSFAHYFLFILKANNPNSTLPSVNATVNTIPEVNLQDYISFSLDELWRKARIFGDSLLDVYVFVDYNIFLRSIMKKFVIGGPLLVIAVCILIYVYKESLLKTNDKPAGSYSRSYELFCKVLKFLKKPFKAVTGYVKFVYKQVVLRKTIIGIWLISLNIVTVIMSLIAWYFYFISSFNIFSIFTQIARLFIDFIIMLAGLPLLIWLAVLLAIYIYYSLDKGYKELSHMEAKNCGFLKTTDYIILLKGPPGSKKTSTAVHMALEWNNIFHAEALDIMFIMEMIFPAFSFSAFRNVVSEYIKSHEVYCLPQCDMIVDEIEEVYNRTPSPAILYGYDTDLFAYDRDTGTALIDIFSAMRIYARAYFIYCNDRPIISALPIRLDGFFDRSKHLKKWCGEFFKRSMREAKKISKYSYILDEDVVRLGKKMDPNNRFNGTFGYGIWVKPEVGKSHGNQHETEGQRKDDENANEKNDMFHWILKFIRHACSTVYHKCFLRWIFDEQRAEDVPANIRQLCSVVGIAETSEMKLALPFAKKIDWLYEKTYKPFVSFYENYCNKRSDMILSVMLMKFAVSAIYNLYWYVYNTFGYFELLLELEKGSTYGQSDSEKKTHIYYFFCKLGHAERFSTDSHSQWFAKEQIAAGLGMMDYDSYDSLKMTPEQMDKQHDFFVEKMKGFNGVLNLQEERDADYAEKNYSYKKRKSKPKEESIFDSDFDIPEL